VNAPKPPATFEEARRQAHAALRAGRAVTAERWLRTLLAQAPDEVNCLWILGVALLDQDRLEESIATLERACARAPDFAHARVDLARAYRRGGRAAQAREEVRRVLEAHPHHHRAWLAYGDALVDLKQYDDARIAFERARLTDPERERVEAATAALVADDRKKAEALFRAILQADPSHVAALVGIAAVSLAADKPWDAERLLRHALRQSAHVPLALRGLVPALLALGRVQEAEESARRVLQVEPENPQSWVTVAVVATRLLQQERSLEAYEKAAALKPEEERIRLSIGHVQKTLGRRGDSEASYKAALAINPAMGAAYWSLADLKNYTFSDAEISAMQGLLQGDRPRDDVAQVHFALGKAFEQRQDYPKAFEHYAQGNTLRSLDAPFDIEGFERRSARIQAFFDRQFFATYAGSGNPSRAPIFIVGLPRSGSTLLEQILASHSHVEGTMELPNIITLVHQFDDMATSRDGYPQTLRDIPSAALAALGSRYMEETAPLRAAERQHFTDKLPNNFSHIGLIQAILPNATVIDARRHPMDACFSTFKQHFASGQTFSYDLEDLGRYYRSYLSLMDHWDTVLPGKVLHVQYEDMVREPELQIRRLLKHCGLDFEPACLSFHTTRRSVRTASAEQVRQPIYASGVGYWRHFERELEPLRRALGDALARFG